MLATLDPPAFDDGDDGVDADAPRLPTESHVERLRRWSRSDNIVLEVGHDGAAEISDEELNKLGMRVVREYDIDQASRSAWLEKNDEAMRLAMQVAETKSYPWPKAANVIFPLITTAALQFAARAYPAIVPGREVIKGVVIGDDDGLPAMAQGQPAAIPQQPLQPAQPQQWIVPPGFKQERANRIGQHMSWQLLDEMPEWEDETDKLLHILPIVGCVFRKTFFDSGRKRNASLMVQAAHVCIAYMAKSLETAPRITEEVSFYPLEILEMEGVGTFREINYSATPEEGDDRDAPVKFLEQHRWWDLDGDGYPEPYVVTVERHSSRVVRIVARYEIDGIHYSTGKGRIVRIDPVHFYTKYDFLPNPEGGIYGVGFGQLLKPINEAINTTLNMLLDAGHLANVGGGFVGKGLAMNSGTLRFRPGEWKEVNSTGSSVRESMVPLPVPGPSPVLFQLLGMLIEAGKEVASIKDILTGEALPANTPATTMLAMVEQGLKQFTAIFKRVHRSLKAEFAKLYDLNRLYLEDEASYKVGNAWRTVTRADYEKGSGVEPISDPTMVSDMQKLGRAAFLQTFVGNPMMDAKEITTRVLRSADIDNIDKLFNPNPPPNSEIIKLQMEMALKKQALDQGEQNNARKQAQEEAGLQLRAKHDAALIETEQAKAIQARAAAILALAQSDKLVGDQHMDWLSHQLDVEKARMDALAGVQTSGTAAAIDPQTVTPGTPESKFAPPDPTQAPPQMRPQGGLGTPQGGMPGQDMSQPIVVPSDHPTLAGARQAPDGKIYTPDPRRPGKFFEVRT